MTTIPNERLERTRRPVRPRVRRSPLMVVSGVVMIVAGSLISVGIYTNLNHTQPVLAVVTPVSRGQQITHADLTTVQISFDPILKPLPASELSTVVGQYATVDLLPGSFLTAQSVGSRITPGPDEAEVGIALTAGQFPNAGLQPGDKVELVPIPAPSNPTPPEQGYPGMISTITISGTNMIGTIIVKQDDARVVSVLAATNDLALILIARG